MSDLFREPPVEERSKVLRKLNLSRDLLKYGGIALGVLVVLVALILYWNRGSHVVLRGSFQKVRIQPLEEQSTVVVIDFRFVNPSNFPFIVRRADVFLVDAGGDRHEGFTIADVDADRVFQYYPLLGPKYNRSLILRDRVESKQSLDRMISARFAMPESEVQARKQLIVRVEDVDGTVSEIVEEPGARNS
ncbi:MAG: hypothetical protein KIT09_33690 [Bryobacteraceae bacterium]|nr:hypothetical protein [Bryobacteraceae bacterium]